MTVADRRSLTWGVAFERVAIAAVVAIVYWAGRKLESLSESVNQLAQQMSVANQRASDQDRRLDKVEGRMDRLEDGQRSRH